MMLGSPSEAGSMESRIRTGLFSWRGWEVLGAVLCVAVAFVLFGLNIYWGDLNQDEGWYLYAARLVSRGKLPYKDFAFTQGPVLPLIYSRFTPWIGRYGILFGRIATATLGGLSCLLATALVVIMVPRGVRLSGAVLCLAFLVCNVYQSYFLSVVKTYSLTALLVMAGFLALTFGLRYRRSYGVAVGSFLMALAAGVRLSAGAVLPVIGLALLWRREKWGDRFWLAFGVGGLVGLTIWIAPFAWIAPEGFRFALFEYHAGRSAGSALASVVYKAGFISRTVQAYFVACAAILALWLRRSTQGPVVRDDVSGFLVRVLWLAVAAVTVVHLSAPFPYEDYQVFIFPAAAAALAITLAHWFAARSDSADRLAQRRAIIMFVVLANIGSAFSSPINQSWFIRGRDRIWWPMKEQSPICQLREVAAAINELSWLNSLLLTQDIYLAVEADMDVPEGLEMGPFAYFPDLPDERARTLKVVNRNLLREILRTSTARVAAFSGYGLSIRCPEVLPLSDEEREELFGILESRYRLVAEVPHFGQAFTTLKLYVRVDPRQELH